MSVVPLEVQKQLRKPEGAEGEKIGTAFLEVNKQVVNTAIDKVEIRPGIRVIDVGCGSGYLLQKLSELVDDGEIIGVDPSDVMVNQSRFLNQVACETGQVKVIVGATPDLPVEDSSADYVLVINVIYFWPRGEILEHLEDIARVLREGGSLVIYMTDADYLREQVGSDENVFVLYETDDVVAKLSEVDFRDITCEAVPTESGGTGYILVARKR